MHRFFKIGGLHRALKQGLRLGRNPARPVSSGSAIENAEGESPYWRDSATIILGAKDAVDFDLSGSTKSNGNGNRANEFDYKVLFLERNKKSKFFGGAEVFPGGTVCDADFDLEWANVFRFCTKRDLGDIIKDLNIGRKRAPMLTAYDRHTAIPPDLGFRIAAIRQMFEESGVLLVKGARMPNVEDSVIEEFKTKVKKDPRKFATYCKELSVVPDVWALQEWSNWLTPPPVTNNQKAKGPPAKPNRFDTIFYLCCLDWIPLVHIDGQEITDARWVSPEDYFEDGHVKNGPQPFEMARVCNFPKLAVLHTFASQRAALGLERYMSIYLQCKDGRIGVLPGDDLYPDKPDYEGLKPSKPLPHTIQELRSVTKRHHRQEFPEDSTDSFYVCNVDLKYGQPLPNRKLHMLNGSL